MINDLLKMVLIIVFFAAMLAAVVTILVGPIFLLAWLADDLYSNIWEANGSAPQITFWQWVGISALLRLFLPKPSVHFETKGQ